MTARREQNDTWIVRLINKVEASGFTGVVASYFDGGLKIGLSAARGDDRKTISCSAAACIEEGDELISMLGKSFDKFR